MKLVIAVLGSLVATGAFAQTLPSVEAEIAPGMGIPALGIAAAAMPSLATMGPNGDPLGYPEFLMIGGIGTPGVVAFATGVGEPDIATGSLGSRQ